MNVLYILNTSGISSAQRSSHHLRWIFPKENKKIYVQACRVKLNHSVLKNQGPTPNRDISAAANIIFGIGGGGVAGLGGINRRRQSLNRMVGVLYHAIPLVLGSSYLELDICHRRVVSDRRWGLVLRLPSNDL